MKAFRRSQTHFASSRLPFEFRRLPTKPKTPTELLSFNFLAALMKQTCCYNIFQQTKYSLLTRGISKLPHFRWHPSSPRLLRANARGSSRDVQRVARWMKLHLLSYQKKEMLSCNSRQGRSQVAECVFVWWKDLRQASSSSC